MIQLLDELHVGEYRGIAGEVERTMVEQVEHEAGGLSPVHDGVAVLNTATVYGMSHGYLQRTRGLRSALVHAAAVLHALRSQPKTDLVDGDYLGLELLGDRNRIVYMIEMAVRNQHR